MKRLTFWQAVPLSAALIFGILVGCQPPPPPPVTAKPVELNAVTIAELNGIIAGHKGNVVLIDVWFLGCAPCVKRFPKFVELHHELQADGLVCITLDTYREELKKKGDVLDFLKQQGADTQNLIVNDREATQDAWQTQYDAVATPSYVIFDRNGKWVPTPAPEDKENMTRILKKLLADK